MIPIWHMEDLLEERDEYVKNNGIPPKDDLNRKRISSQYEASYEQAKCIKGKDLSDFPHPDDLWGLR